MYYTEPLTGELSGLNWCSEQESNLRRPVLQTGALPAELSLRIGTRGRIRTGMLFSACF